MKMNRKVKRIIALLMVFICTWNLDGGSISMLAHAAEEQSVAQTDGQPTQDEEPLLEDTQLVQDAPAAVITINGTETTFTEAGFNAALALGYKETIDCALQGATGPVTFYRLNENDLEPDKTPEEQEDGWTVLQSTDILMPGNYYLGYLNEDGFYRMNNAGFRITKVNVGSPTELAWEGMKAAWSAPTKSDNNKDLDAGLNFSYAVTLWKDGTKVKEKTTTEQYFDFASEIEENGYGSYTFKVIATATNAGDRYTQSKESESSVYRYSDTVAPQITGFTVGDAAVETEKNRLVGTATDNVAVTAYAFTTEGTAPAAESTAWIPAGTADETGAYRLISGVLDASGNYYLHVRDAEGNVTSSDNTIKVTRIVCYAQMSDAGLNTTSHSSCYWLFGDTASVNIGNAIATGYVFGGWYENAAFTGTTVTAVQIGAAGAEGAMTIPAGQDYKLYAKFTAQTYNISITTSADSNSGVKEYDGTSDGCGIALTAELAHVDYDSISYEWFYKSEEPDTWISVGSGTAGADAFTNSYTIYNVKESGSYRVVATVSLNGNTYTASVEKTVQITKRALTLQIEDAEIAYGDAVPESFSVSVKAGLAASDAFDTMLADGSLVLGTFTTDYDPDSADKSAATAYTIKQSTDHPTTADNYAVTVEPGTLTVSPKNVEAEDSGVTLTFRVLKSAVSDGTYGDDVKSDDLYYYPTTFTESYTAEQVKPDVVAWDQDVQIAASLYTVGYTDNINAGSLAKANVTFTGNYDGSLSIGFTITKQKYESSVQMKDAASVIYTDTAAWTYGETAFTPFVTPNYAGTDVTYYYAKRAVSEEGNPETAQAPALDRLTAETTMPEDAGDYYVWAVIAGNGNYEEVETAAFPFTIKKRDITLTAISYVDGDDDTEHNAWTYDGVAHAADTYTQVGEFAGTDAFRSVKVTGTITDCGEVDNVITYELTPSTKPENYNIVCINGKLQVKQIALPVPSGFAWDTVHPGTLTFTPVSRKNLVVEYKIAVYRADTFGTADATPVHAETTGETTIDVSAAIKNDIALNGVTGYKATIVAVPKEEAGTVWENYTESETGKSGACYTAKITIQKEPSVAKVTEQGTDTEVETCYLIAGESMDLEAEYTPGYSSASWMPAVVEPAEANAASYIDIADNYFRKNTITAKADMPSACEINLTVSADDSSPSIVLYDAQNTSDAKSVKFTIRAYDEIGIEGYVLVRREDGPIDRTTLTFTPMQRDGENSPYYTATEYVQEEGTYCLFVKDTAGNISSRTLDENVITVYEIAFANGATGEDAGLFGGEAMPTLYKVANSTITLPEVSYTKKGGTFKNWSGATGQIYNNKAAYAANASDTLTAQWSDEKYSYTVHYYYQDISETGVVSYSETPELTKTYTGSYNAVITSASDSIQLTREGFELDESEGYVDSVTLGTTENPVVNVYYKRSSYTIRYQYHNPATNADFDESDSYYYGQIYTIRENPSIPGYTFSGWDFGDFDTKETTMPAKNLVVTGRFTADAVEYKIVYHLQNLPAVTGTITGGDYAETASSVYTMDASKTEEEHALQGALVTADIADAPDIEGFTKTAVSVTNGGADTDALPVETGTTNPQTTASGTADAEQTLYINYYYTRNIYDMTLYVYRDKRDVVENIIFNHTWRFSYGTAFSQDDIAYLQSYGYSETPKDNKWIAAYVNEDGTIKSEFSSYILANYTDWSTGAKPTGMPAGNVSITKEYVENTSASYQVEFYLQTMDSDTKQLKYPDAPNYTVYYYDAIGKTIEIGGTDQEYNAETNTAYLNYNTIGNMLDANFSAYTFDETAENNQIRTIIKKDSEATGANDNKIRVYFKRAEVATTITYRYKPTGESAYITLVSYTFKQPWGTYYEFDPAAYYYGGAENKAVPANNSQYNLPDDSSQQGTITNVQSKPDALSTNYNEGTYAISYESYQYFSNSGHSWQPTDQIDTATELAERRTLRYQVGQKNNYINVNYVHIDTTKTYEMDLYYSSTDPDTQLTETVGNDFSVTYEGGGTADAGTTYYIRIANYNDLFDIGYQSINADGYDTYKVEQYINVTSASDVTGTLKSGFIPVTVTNSNGTGTYYEYTDGSTKYLYIANKNNSFIWGKRLSFNVEATDNGAKLGRKHASSLVNTGYELRVSGSYNADYTTKASSCTNGAAPYRLQYNYYQEKVDQKTLTFIMGSKTVSKAVDYNSTIQPSTDTWVSSIFTVDEGYRIVWYENEDYTNPVGDTIYTITANKKFYGRREKSLIDNYSYMSYELSENVRLNRPTELCAANGVTESADGNLYITETNYASFTWNEVSALTNSGYEILTENITKSYIDNNQYNASGVETNPVVNYTAKRYAYYIDGELVMIKEQNSALSYSEITLAYDSDDYKKPGFAYSDKNANNKSNGYCQKEPVSLCAFYQRLSYEETEIRPSVANSKIDKTTVYTKTYGNRITLATPSKVGYTFAGWKFTTTEIGGQAATEIDKATLHYTAHDIASGKNATFVMPPYAITVSAIWEPAEFDYDLMSYFQQDDEGYRTELMKKVLEAASGASAVIIKYKQDSMETTHSGSKVVVDTQTVCFYEEAGVTYYFLCNADAAMEITVSAKNLVAAKRTIRVKTAVTYRVADYQTLDVSAFDIYGYAFTAYATDEATASLGRDDHFIADPSMTLCHYFSRTKGYRVRLLGLSTDSKTGAKTEDGLTLKGEGNSYYFGQTISVTAIVEPGYTFKGWYHAEDVLDNYTGVENITDTAFYAYEELKTSFDSSASLPNNMTVDEVTGMKKYTVQITLEQAMDLVAVTEPAGLDGTKYTVKITSGNDDYTYGYAQDKKNYLTANVEFTDGSYASKVSVVGYQWYLLASDTEEPSEENKIAGATSSTYLIPTGKDAGTYHYQCVVTLKQTENGREGTAQAATPYPITVKQINGEYYTSADYDALYDAATHSITLRVNGGSVGKKPEKCDIYFSEQLLETWEAVESALTGGSVQKVSVSENMGDVISIPAAFLYKNVELEGEGTPKTHTVYFYIHTDEAGLDPNFKDTYGSDTVCIRPITLTLGSTTNAFEKTYDAKEKVEGSLSDAESDYYRLIKGDGDKKYYTISNAVLNSETGWNLSCDAAFNSKHVEDANAVTLSELKIVGADQATVNPNYRFADGYTFTLSGNINPYMLHLTWSAQTSFVYNGEKQAVSAVLADTNTPPDDNLEVISVGAQKNAGTYMATAAVKTEGKEYKASDYYFDISSHAYEITPCPITVAPKNTTVAYTKAMQYITDFTASKSGEEAADIQADGACSALATGEKFGMSTIKTDQGGKEAGNYTITVKADGIKIFDEAGADITYDYTITAGIGTLTIGQKTVTLSGIEANDKEYDGTDAATLKTKKVTIGGVEKTVLDPVTIDGVASGDEVYVLADKVTDVKFARTGYGSDIQVTFAISADALAGADASNYLLDTENSQKETTASITKHRVTVKAVDLSDGTIYGVTPNYSVEYEGFLNGDTASVVSGQPIYLLDNEDYSSQTYTIGEGVSAVTGTKIPYKEGGYTITLQTDANGYVAGLSADNYVFVPEETSTAKLVITKRPITVTGKNRDSKITKDYDSTTDVGETLVAGTDYEFEQAGTTGSTGCLPGDTVAITYKAVYNSKDVASANKINVSEVALTAAGDSGNYILTESSKSFSVAGAITPVQLTVKADNKNITYGDAAPVYTATATGFVGSDMDGESNQKTLTNGSGITLTCGYDTSDANKRKADTYGIMVSDLTDTNYTLVADNSGVLTVEKKTITAGVEDRTIIYGKEDPTAPAFTSGYVGTFEGWITAYGDSTDSILTTEAKNSITYTLEGMPGKTAADYPYKEGGYKILVNCDALNTNPATYPNYTFESEDGTLTVNRQYISVSGIKVGNQTVDGETYTNGKRYDGTTEAFLDFSDIKFTCYVNGAAGSEYTAQQLLPDAAGLAGEALYAKICDNLAVTGTYTQKGISEDESRDPKDIDVSLTMELVAGSYLAQRYELIRTEADAAATGISGIQVSQTATTGKIYRRPITIKVFYGQMTDSTILYGEAIQANNYGFEVIRGSFAENEGIGNLNGQIAYKIVNALGEEYSPTSGVGTYYVKQVGNLSDENTNYRLTIVGSGTAVTENAPIVVDPNTLATPAPKWSSEAPGTIQWAKAADIGNVKVQEYQVALYKNGSETAIASNTVTRIEDAAVYTIDYADTIRNNGPGAYKVTVKAIATKDDTNNPASNPNVKDSNVGTSELLYAADMSVAYAEDAVTQAAATTVGESPEVTENAGMASSIVIKKTADAVSGTTSYVVIDGESVTVQADWYNLNGYRTGYKLPDTPWTIKKGDTDTTDLTVTGGTDNSAAGSYTATVKADLSSSDAITMKLALAKRSATLAATIQTIKGEEAYGYTAESAPSFEAMPQPTGDNVEASQYVYTYKWTYNKLIGTEEPLKNQTGDSTCKEMKIQTGLPAFSPYYNVYCEITATRKDNGETVSLTGSKRPKATLKITKAVVDADAITAVVSGWTYGQTRKVPELTQSTGSIPSGIGNKHYYYSTDPDADRSGWTEWKEGSEPKDAGIYYLIAKVDASDNYAAFETTNAITFEISKAQLGKKEASDAVLASADLQMQASTKAPYGIAAWPTVAGPKENGDSTTSYITPSYTATLYRIDGIGSEALGDGTEVCTYTADDVTINTMTHICTLDMTDDMNDTGTYYYTVQAISDNQGNCLDSAVVRSGNYFISTDVQVTDAYGQSLLPAGSQSVEYTYDAKDVTLKVGVSEGSTCQWFKNGVAISGATSSSLKVRYVEDSGVYSCRITATGQTYDTTHITMTIKPRTITIVTGSAEKTYDAAALTKDAWNIKENQADTMVTGSETMTETATGNVVSSVQVTGSLTDVAYADGAVTAVENTCNLAGLVVEEVNPDHTRKVVYNASMVAAGTANYSIETEPGTLCVTKRPVTITSGSDEKVYDGTALTEHSNTPSGVTDVTESGLVSGHTISGIVYTGTITDVAYRTVTTEGGQVAEVTTVENTFDSVQIKDAGSQDVTANYAITKVYGTLKVTPVALSQVTVTPDDFTHDGSLKGPTSIVVSAQNTALTPVENTDYDITENTAAKKVRQASAVGTYTIEAVGKGNYTGTVSATYQIVDRVAPVVTGIENGKVYCETKPITITDLNLTDVLIQKKTGEATWEDVVHRTGVSEQDGLMTGTFTYDLTGTEDGTIYRIVATDISGNTNAAMQVTVYDDHAFTNYQDVADTMKTKRKAACDHGCGETDTRVRAWGTVSWSYAYSYSIEESPGVESGVQGVAARATYAYVYLKQNGTVIATKLVSCDNICGTSAGSPAVTGSDTYEFTSYNPADATSASGDTLLPVGDADGNPYTYSIVVEPVKRDGERYSAVRDYTVDYPAGYTEDAGYKTDITYTPGRFRVPWEVTVSGYTVTEDGTALVPDAIYVKVLYAYSEDANDTETDEGYQIISQQAEAGNAGVRCEKVRQADGSYTYSGSYPVWKYQGGTTLSYYHRIQVVGYEYGGQTYDVTASKYKSVNDNDHVNHTIYYVPGDDEADNGSASGTIRYDFSSISMPVLVFDYNEGADTTNVVTCATTSIAKAYGAAVSELEISNVTPSRPGYEFLGWYTAAEGGTKVTQIASLTGTTIVYAHWRETVAPTGAITHDNISYVTYITSPQFTTYTNKKHVTIAAQDTAGTVTNTGVSDIAYYVAAAPVADSVLQGDTLSWTVKQQPFATDEYGRSTVSFDLGEDGPAIVYVRITDGAGNRTYISTDGLVLDTAKPSVQGVVDGGIYCENKAVTITDTNLKKVTIRKYENDAWTDERVEDSVTGTSFPYTLTGSEEGTRYQITAEDKAGNVTDTIEVTIYSGHKFTHYEDAPEGENIRRAECDHGCGAVDSYEAGYFDVPWEVTITDYPQTAGGQDIVPDAVYVKVLYADSETASDSEYQIVSRQAGTEDAGVRCEKIKQADGTYTYSGSYPVQKYQDRTTLSYYHRIQVVGYTYQGVTYDVTADNYKSINDSDHVNHTIYYVPGDDVGDHGRASGTIRYELGTLDMPVLCFEYNQSIDETSPVTCDVTQLVKPYGAEVSETELAGVIPERPGYAFLGWYTAAEGGTKVTGIDALTGTMTVYAHWRENVPPKITGVTDGQVSCGVVTFGASDAHLARVLLNGEDITDQLTNGTFELVPDEEIPAHIPQPQRIQAYDEAGNVTECTVILHNGHTYKPETVICWSEDYTSATAEFICERDESHTVIVDCVITKTTGEDGDVYVAVATLDGRAYTNRVHIVNDTTLTDEEDTRIRVVIQEGIKDIPATLLAMNLDTEQKIYDKMKAGLRAYCDRSYEDDHLVLYDVLLQISFDDGRTWQTVTEDNFPDGSLPITIPYPEGTSMEEYNFVAAHMFTHNFRGKYAGDLEYPNVTKKSDGLHLTVSGLSPILIGWTEVVPEDVTTTEVQAPDAEIIPGKPDKAEVQENTNESAKTGDTAMPVAIGGIMISAFAMIVLLVRNKKKQFK